MRTRRRLFFGCRSSLFTAVLLATAYLSLATCGKDSPTKPTTPEPTPPPPPPPAPVATRIEITPSSVTLNSLGQTAPLTARVFDQNNAVLSGATAAWSSSLPGVATVSSQGVVTAVANGTAQITARSGSATGSITATVKQSAGSIVIEPSSATLMAIGETVQLVASVLDKNRQPVAGSEVAWSSSDVSVASVSDAGLVTAVGNGSVTVAARSGSASASVPVTVMQSAGSVVIEPTSATLMSLGETVQLTASVLDGNGQPVAGDEVAWSSSDTAVATVSDQGLVTAVANGTAQITVRAGEVSASVPVTVMIAGRDREALVALYNSTNGPNWTNATNWLSEEPLGTWFGVRTNERGEVTGLDLEENNLQGRIPAELGKLSHLTVLYLSDRLLGGSIPSEMGQLHNLRHLRIHSAQLTGQIPSELGQLRKLQELNLQNNQLTGQIPSELGQLRDLWFLGLVRNQLTGPIPSELGQLGNLTSLYISDNALTGSIPSKLGQLHSLRALWIHNNVLTGSIPPELGELSNLTILHMHNNELTGSVPGEFGALRNLEHLTLFNNPGLYGPLPEEITKLANLKRILLDETYLCVPPTDGFQAWYRGIPERRGDICPDQERDALIALYNRTDGPNWTRSANWLTFAPLNKWHGVTTDAEGKVVTLELDSNNLDGSLPGSLGDLTRLNTLNLSFNTGLSGPLPLTFTRLDLEELLLEETQLCAPPDNDFQDWLAGIPSRNGADCIDTRQDFYALDMLYNSTNGPDWTNRTNWLSDKPLGSWHGVSVDTRGRVTEVYLGDNNLNGIIPSEIRQLDALTSLSLPENQLSEEIPVEIGQLLNLTHLNLSLNLFYGSIPAELGQLTNLRELDIESNQLAGVIPPEIVQLKNLEILSLRFNKLAGNIPPELGQLSHLTRLGLGHNNLSGNIPPELGHLQSLEVLLLFKNQLKGAIPIELGQLQNLTSLWLSDNQLSGTIPSQIGRLQNLEELNLSHNLLTGTIPSELGQLSKLQQLRLSFNLLKGNIPNTFADLASLKRLGLTENNAMSGAIPLELTRLELEELLLGGTELCVPADVLVLDWLNSISNSRVARCDIYQGRSRAYLTQAIQSFSFPVPLLAGEEALLRVFLTDQSDVDIAIPTIRAHFYDKDNLVYSTEIPGDEAFVASRIDESDLAATVNARIPGSILAPGLEMIIEIDPDGELDPSLGIASRLPPMGRTSLDVTVVPPLDLTLVPLLWTENPDYDLVNTVNALSSEDDLFRFTRDLLPVADFELNVREPLWIPVEPVFGNTVITYVRVVHAMDGASGHYMGVLKGGGGGTNNRSRVIVAGLQGDVIAHELGHSMSLFHAPCGEPLGIDSDYPYLDGSIGAWGYDILNGVLVSPDTPDLMSYCGPPVWISDYHFTRALGFRVLQEQAILAATYSPPARSLLLWGGLSENGELILEPAFVVDAPPLPPQMGGPYRIIGEDKGGGTVFSLRFGMAEIADGEGGSFAFVVPVRADWSGRLARVTLTGPEGVSVLGDEDDLSAALLLDGATGQVRGILHDWPTAGVSDVPARHVLPEPGLDVIISRGIPDRDDW